MVRLDGLFQCCTRQPTITIESKDVLTLCGPVFISITNEQAEFLGGKDLDVVDRYDGRETILERLDLSIDT